jgi:ABC-type glycerol-3-phosphate transport system substrate-binding protein
MSPLEYGLIVLLLPGIGLILWLALREKKSKLLITSWGDLQENHVLINLIGEFRKENPHCDVQIERIPFPDYVPTLTRDIAAASGPDVIFVEANNFMDFYAQKSLAPLNEFIQRDHLDLNSFYPQIVNRFSVKNQVYALPRDTAPICLVYYNKQAFEEAGLPFPTGQWDWKGFAETAQKLVKRDREGKILRWGLVENWAMTDGWVYSGGGSYVDNPKDPKKWTFGTDPLTRMAIQFRADLIHKYKVMASPASDETIGGENTSALFASGRAAMYISGVWKTPFFREAIKDFQWDVALMPRSPLGARGCSAGGSGYAITRSSLYKGQAWKFIQFITGETGARKLAETGLAQPALIRVAGSPAFLDGKDPANKKLLLDAVQYGKYSPLCGNWWEAFYYIATGLNPIWAENQNVEEVLQKIQKHLDTIPPKPL